MSNSKYGAVEKGIPLPTPRNNIGTMDLLRAMEVGDSVLFPNKCTRAVLGRLPGKKFTTRSVEGGLRVWRVE